MKHFYITFSNKSKQKKYICIYIRYMYYYIFLNSVLMVVQICYILFLDVSFFLL